MKQYFVLLGILFSFFGSVQAQEKIDYGTTNCQLCNMVIKDNRFASQAIKQNNQTLYFDAIECLLNYLKANNEIDFKSMYVSDYANPEIFISVTTAFYLKSNIIKSPMGANLSAFSSKEKAERFKTLEKDALYTWQQLNRAFKDKAFGNITHDHHNHLRPDSHAPIGVMGDHLHHKGGLMVSLRYMGMMMDGNKMATDNIADVAIFQEYMVAPQEMSMQMYMLGVMYAPTNRLTLSAMQNLIKNDMDLTDQMTMNGMIMQHDFSTNSSGFGDLKLNALYGLFSHDINSLHLNTGISLPVGSIKERDDTPMMEDAKLPYAMQLGSGTFDVTAGATYKELYPFFSWGSQFLATFRTGKNTEEYRFGNHYQLNLWGAYRLFENVSLSGRALGTVISDIEGADPQLNPMMVTTADIENYGGEKIKLFGGVNVSFPQTSVFKNIRIAAEMGAPVYEGYNGIQMNENLSFVIGLKYSIL
ncbi:nitrous oxide reductase accessory protein NosL [Marixanthomonas ophiurae]|uniref:Uncharacterized protein n=1 Tax=Marixanthomonas ophiurae TaxID=387659 RepID=A0A3E1QDM6_9FLAO|nr:nitrous oxide reductase accessory protein NosL [Marixanthomonas ophiurae]RFN60258.1 hypothetical protein DZ858_09520 [Marixanthomonas ophiurae]